jgi:hypothetical protein
MALDFLEFCDNDLRSGSAVRDDDRINLFAMAHGLDVMCTLPGLVEHQLPNESLLGNAHHDSRTSLTPIPQTAEEAAAIDWEGDILHIGKHYRDNYWWLTTELTTQAQVRYQAHRKAHEIAIMSSQIREHVCSLIQPQPNSQALPITPPQA